MKTENTIREELKHIAPVLANVEKQGNDVVSAEFFSALNENVMNAIRAAEKQKELQPIAPLLASLEKNKEAVVSDTFFAQMQAKTWKQIQSQSSTTKKQVSKKTNALDRLLDLLFRPSFAMGFAAFCALVFCGTLFLSNNSTQDYTTIASAQQLTNSEIQAYIAENNDEFDESILTKDWETIDNKSILENSTLNEEELNAYYNSELNNEKI
ncbi:MAG: hypothetical protein JNL95_00720 [Chitinophagales bacterium]|nr:hypothetical protein [Chitinophagales bacterium]